MCLQVFLCVLDKTLKKLEQGESLEEALKRVNMSVENLSLLTDFPIGAYVLSIGYCYFNVFKDFSGTVCAYMPFYIRLFQKLTMFFIPHLWPNMLG